MNFKENKNVKVSHEKRNHKINLLILKSFIMIKKVLGGIGLLAIAAVAAWNVNLSSQSNDLSELSLANVEALASGESGGERVCYNTITTQAGVQTLYCGTCTYISGSPSWISGKGKCN
jgi:hypothetical protein